MTAYRKLSVIAGLTFWLGHFPTTDVSAQSNNVDNDMYVTVDRLIRRTCPSTDCGDVGGLLFGEKVKILEEKDGWGRITQRYDAACRDGLSAYVDNGSAECNSSNGIVDGQMAEWVALQFLAQGSAPAPTASSAIEKLIVGSDNFQSHREVFTTSAQRLIDSGTCSESDFLDMGGWVSSTSQGPNVYFIYCGGMMPDNRVYLNVSTGQDYR